MKNFVTNSLHERISGVTPETETETETEVETECAELSGDTSEQSVTSIPLIKKDGEFLIHQADIDQWQDTFPGIDVLSEVKKARQWSIDNPKRRKTNAGIRRHITAWLGRAQDKHGKDHGYGPSKPSCDVCDYNQRSPCSNLSKPGFDPEKCGAFRRKQ